MVNVDFADRSRPTGMELFEVMPVIVGGNPEDPENKAWLTRRQHIEAVRYWNHIISEMRESKVGGN
jgi:hypothetical protein